MSSEWIQLSFPTKVLMSAEMHSRRCGSLCLAGVLALACGLFADAVPAQKIAPLPVATVLNAREFAPYSPVQFSPDGRWLAYTVLRPGQERRSETGNRSMHGFPWFGLNAEIYILNVKTREQRDLTPGKDDNCLPRWAPDGRHLAFFSNRGGSPGARLWLWDAERNTFRKLSDLAVAGDQMQWTPDSKHLIVTTAAETADLTTRSVARPAVLVYESFPLSSATQKQPSSAPWDLGELRNLVLVDASTGDADLLIHSERITTYYLSPDGLRLAYTVPERFEQPGSQQMLYDIAVTDIRSKQRNIVAHAVRLDYTADSLSWSPDSHKLAFRTGGQEERSNDCYVVDIANRGPQNVSGLPADPKLSQHRGLQPLWNAKGDTVYFLRDGVLWRSDVTQHMAMRVAQIAHREIVQLIPVSGNRLWTDDTGGAAVVLAHDLLGMEDGFYKVDLRDGRVIALKEGDECYTCAIQDTYVAVSGAGDHATYFAENAQHETELWMADRSFRTYQRLTDLNPALSLYSMGTSRLVHWMSDDGVPLKGALLLPATYKEGQRYPFLVYVYGGSYSSKDLDRFGLVYPGPFNMQLFATRGYAVLLPDSPQQTGTPMLDTVKTVLPGVSKIVEMGIADPDRIGVMGHSNGGYSTMALLAQTHRFRAAVEISGMADLISLYGEMSEDGSAYGTSVLEHGQDSLAGSPWQVRDRYMENSPFFYFNNISTPLLIVHGTADTAVSAYLGDQVFVGLRRLAKEVEYAKYVDEGHSPSSWSYRNKLDFCHRMIDWFDAHLRENSTRSAEPTSSP